MVSEFKKHKQEKYVHEYVVQFVKLKGLEINVNFLLRITTLIILLPVLKMR